MAMDFKLSDEFVDSYRGREVPWGFKDAAGNSLGEVTYLRTYSRKMDNGEKETWVDTCRRVIEGMFTIQKWHCRDNHIEWKNDKAQRTAKDAFDRMFHMKWLPAGRGLFAMGSPLVMEERNSAPLQSCAFVTTEESVADAMTFLFDASMVGIGVGFDTSGAGKFEVKAPEVSDTSFVIPDSREGWVESLAILLTAYLDEGTRRRALPEFDYSQIRPAGAPIRRFGGVASGPEPLKRMHSMIGDILKKRVGSSLEMVDIVDIGNIIGTCVVAGSTRRSAEIAFVDSDSPDAEDFRNLKNAEKFPERQAWSWMSNNSIRTHIGDDYSAYMDGIQLNGEPGLVWMDTAQNYGRLKDPQSQADSKVKATNPCVTGDTWVTTANGPRQVQDLVGKRFNAIVNGRAFSSTDKGFFSTGTKQVYRLVTSDGRSVRLTGNHRIMTGNRGWVEASDLNRDDAIVLHDHSGVTWGGRGTQDEGYAIGHLVGDGTFDPNGAILSIYCDSEDNFPSGTKPVEKRLHNLIESLGHRSDWSGWFGPTTNSNQKRLRSAAFTRLAESYGVVRGNKTMTDEIEMASSEFTSGFLRGLFDADGHVEGESTSGGVSIRLTSIDINLLERVQRALSRLGISSAIRNSHAEGRIAFANYPSKASYRLVISGSSAKVFMERVGFEDTDKAAKWAEATGHMVRGFYSTKKTVSLVSLEEDGTEEVFDCTIPGPHAFDANGYVAHNCGEIFLEDGELCNLVEVFPSNMEDREDFIKTLKVAYLYGKSVTLLPTKWEKTNTVMQRNRRIGLSISGVADFVDNHGMSELRSMCEEGYTHLESLDKSYSSWLCIRESVKKTTVKPSGSISILTGSSPGVHWGPGGEYFIRRITFGKHDPLFQTLKDSGYEYEDLEHDPGNAVILFPVHSDAKRSSDEVHAWEKVHLASEMQYWWADNGVSCTVDFGNDEAEDLSRLLPMYEGKLKGISFLPRIDGGAYKHMPYEQISAGKFDQMASSISKADFTVAYGEKGEQAKGEAFCTDDSCEIEIELEEMNSEDKIATLETKIDIAAMISKEN